MAEAGSYGTARSGNWLWAVLVGATLLAMEFVLSASLVPTAWSERVRGNELAWLQEGLGTRTATAVVQRAEQVRDHHDQARDQQPHADVRDRVQGAHARGQAGGHHFSDAPARVPDDSETPMSVEPIPAATPEDPII